MRPIAWLWWVAPAGFVVSCGLSSSQTPGSGGQGGGSTSSSSGMGGSPSTSDTTGGGGSNSSGGGRGGATSSGGGPASGGGGAGGTPAGSGGSSSSGGGGPCAPADHPGVCCPDVDCGHGMKCCHATAGGVMCQQNDCPGNHFDCDDSRDCGGGQLCCGHFNGTGYDGDIHCVPSDQCKLPTTIGDPGPYEMCDTNTGQAICTAGTCHPSAQFGIGNHGFCAIDPS